MAAFVINEWFWEDLSGRNPVARQSETFRVVEKLPASGHQIVIVEGSAFDKKAWAICKNSASMVAQRIGGLFVTTVRENLNICRILKAEELSPVPNEIAEKTNPDDHYLIQAVLAAEGSILVTTDTVLRDAIVSAGLNGISREQFLTEYFPAP